MGKRVRPIGASTPAPADPDRLFAASIITHGKAGALRETGQMMVALSVQDRRRLLCDLVNEESPTDKDKAHAHQVVIEALTEIEAFELVERMRKESRHG